MKSSSHSLEILNKMSREDLDLLFVTACNQNNFKHMWEVVSTDNRGYQPSPMYLKHGLFAACRNQNVEMLSFLLTAIDLEKHADLYIDNAKAFQILFDIELLVNNAGQFTGKGLIEYLIYDYKINKNEIYQAMQYAGRTDIVTNKKIHDMFSKIELEEKLTKGLFIKDNKERLKI